LYERKLQLTQKYFFFSDSFALRLQATEASYTVDCSVVAMLAIEKSKFLNGFYIVFFGVVCLLVFYLKSNLFLSFFKRSVDCQVGNTPPRYGKRIACRC